jgi:2-polyprenyl-3-methyl-5-hydroxy-6-metoxy-1,4-benzoquinol methylase
MVRSGATKSSSRSELLKMRDFGIVPLDAVRDFWNRRPCNIRHSPQPVGTREYFDEVEARKYLVEPHIPAFADFPHWKGRRVLEIGCGIGTATISFLREGARVTAVDLSSESLALARRRAELYGLADKVTFFEADAERLSEIVPPEPYDLVYSFGVLHHTPHPIRAIDQIRAFVRPGSTVKLMMYHTLSWKVFWAVLLGGGGRFGDWRRIIARYSEAQTGCPVTYTYTKRELAGILEARGFQVTEIFVDHIFPYRVADYIAYRYRKVWYFRWMPTAVFRWLERRFGWHLCVTAVAK